MSSMQIRTYVMASAYAHLKKAAAGDSQRARRALETLLPSTRQVAESATPPLWVPVSQCADVFDAVASLSEGDEARARTALIDCGKEAAFEASNTFLRLVMKVLTPSLLAKKLPDVWRRDCTGGNVAAEVSEDGIRNTYSEIGGFNHIAPVAVGFVAFALQAMGKDVTTIDLEDWSLATPAPERFSFSIKWRK